MAHVMMIVLRSRQYEYEANVLCQDAAVGGARSLITPGSPIHLNQGILLTSY